MKGEMMVRRWSIVFFFLALVLICSESRAQPLSSSSMVCFDFVDADIRNVLRAIAEISKKNIVIAEDVKGKITMRLENVTFEEALDVILKTAGMEKIEEDNIIRIVTAKRYEEEQKKIAEMKKEQAREREEKRKMKEDFVAETIFLNFADAGEMEKVVKALYPDINVTVVRSTNSLLLYAPKEKIGEIRKKVKEQDVKPPMVQIEARIVQANANFTRELGIQWGAKYQWKSKILDNKQVEITGGKNFGASSSAAGWTATTGQVGVRETETFPYVVNLPAAVATGAGGALGIYIGSVEDSFNLDAQLTALETQGKGKIISHPKIITSDNKKAVISQGKSVPYATVSQQGTQTQFVDAVLSVEVTPQVTKDENIRLQIKATKNFPDFARTTTAGPPIDKKEASTEVIVKDGETVVIGGIYETTETTSEDGLPFLRRIPLLGWLFKHELKTTDKTELLIFVTPTIIKGLYQGE